MNAVSQMRVPARDSSATIDAQARPLNGEARYRQILQSLPAAIYTCDTEGYITFYNEAAAELWGRHPRLGRDRWCGSWKIFHPDGTPMAHEDCPMGVATRERRSVRGQEILVERPDGSRCFVLPHPDPIRDDSGAIVGMVNMLVNVDGIRGTDQALRLYKEIFAASLDGIAIIAPDGTYLEQNAAHHKLLGYSDQELQGKTPAIHFGQQAFEAIGQALQRDGRFRGVAPSCAKSGQHLDIELSAFTVRDDQGRILCHVGMKRDITERKCAEEALAKRAQEQAVLYQFTDKLHRATSLAEVYEAALDGIINALACQRASILLFDNTAVMRFVAWRALSDGYRKAVEGHSPWQPGDTDPQPVCIEDINNAGIPVALKSVVLAEGIRSLVFMPLVINGKLIGKFMAYYDAPHQYAREELDLGLTIARQLAFGVEQERSEEALRQRTHLLLRQKQVLELIAQDAPLAETMDRLISVIEQQSPGLIGTVLLLDKNKTHLRPFAGKRVPEGWSKLITPLKIGPRQGSCGTAAFRRQPVIVHDIATDPLWASYRDAALSFGLRACWSIPIHSSRGEVLGTFAGYYSQPQRPGDLEWKVVEILSQTAALAIERQQARETSQKLSALIEHSPNFVGVASLDQRCLFLNPAGQALVGISAEEALHTSILDYFPLEERKRVETQILPLLREKGHWDGEVWFRHFKTAALIPVMWNVFLIPDSDTNAPAFFACVSTDITERKKAEEALGRSEKLFRELADSMPQIVWAARPNGSVDYYNKRWYEYSGLPDDQLGEESWRQILHPDDVVHCFETYFACIREQKPYEIEYRFRDRAHGGYRWFLCRALPIRDDSGHVMRWFGTCTDIDDQKRAEERLEAAVEERTASLREAVAQMEEFSYSVSHDLRAPLRAMTSYANVLLEDYASSLDDTARMCIENIRRSSQRMDRLTQDVLTYSRVARAQVNLTRVDLDKLVRDLVHQYIDLQQAPADIHLKSPLPSVQGHEASLAQCISNLLTNALKFVPKGKRPVIRIWAETSGSDVRLWVEDNGIGIKPEFQQRLFQMFERLNPAGTFEGNGIGLAIVRKAMEKMGGRFGLESDGQNGSRFWLQLPKSLS